MREDFIHYIWKHKKFQFTGLKTTKEKQIEIINSGEHNHDSGPDFFNAQIKIDEQVWAGNVELHLKSSDWYAHHHESDTAYDNVILHVVWNHDTEVFRKDNSELDTLVLKDYISNDSIVGYQRLFDQNQKWINCENDFASVDDFVINKWLERLFFERLERKSDEIMTLLHNSKNDWEAVLFKMLAKNFGLKANGASFLNISNSFDFSILRKERLKIKNLEALFFGQGGLLEENSENVYYNELKSIYEYQRNKYKLDNTWIVPLKFFRLRPPGFPTIRLSQLANLYHCNSGLFSDIIESSSLEDIYGKLSIPPSVFWQTHYTFKKSSRQSKKKLTKAFIDLLIINTIIPLKFSYARHQGKNIDDELINWISILNSEHNGIVEKFNELRKVSINAMHSQALIQLKTNYCDKNKCLHCAIGNSILTN